MTTQDDNLIYCPVLKTKSQRLGAPPINGKLGEEVFNTISKAAWDQWIGVQTMIINENRLNLMNRHDREFIASKLRDFMKGEDVSPPKDYVPH